MSEHTTVREGPPSRLARLLPLLESDPDNLTLLADAAETAFVEADPKATAGLLERYAKLAPLPPHEASLAGLAAMQLRDFEGAARHFGTLVEAGERDPAVRFNLAWSLAMLKRFNHALLLLDDETGRELPQAAMLEVQLLHENGEFEAAGERARLYAGLHPDHRGLNAAVSVLALDIEDPELAERSARAAGDHPDALTTLGTLALGRDRAGEAKDLFERALEQNQGVPRAWVGRGLARLMTGDAPHAAADIDKGAQMFGDHLGSWIAAGWAHFVSREPVAARARFETALELDPTFAETHGSLAVLDLLAGDADKARERTEIALRLDRNCYSAALARSLLAAGSGNQEAAARIFETAINVPVDNQGRTIAQALARLGLTGAG